MQHRYIFILIILTLFSTNVVGEETDMSVELKIDPDKYMEYKTRDVKISNTDKKVKAGAESIDAVWKQLSEMQEQNNEEGVKQKVSDLIGMTNNVIRHLDAMEKKVEQNRLMAMQMLKSNKKKYKHAPVSLKGNKRKLAASQYAMLSKSAKKRYGRAIKDMEKHIESSAHWAVLLAEYQAATPSRIDTESGLNHVINVASIKRKTIAAQRRKHEAQYSLLKLIIEDYINREMLGGEQYANDNETLDHARKFTESVLQQSPTDDENPFN